MPHSHHSHSGQFCKHAAGSLEDVVLQAIKQGFTTYGLSEHIPRLRQCDLYPEEQDSCPDDLIRLFDSFLDEAHRLKLLYASEINLLVGLETEHITEDDLDYLDELLQRHGHRVEYIVGSVHHVNQIPIDFDRPTFEKALRSIDIGHTGDQTGDDARMGSYLSSYFDAQYEVLQRFHPEVVGHFDLCRLFKPETRFKDYPDAFKKLERNILYGISYGALFELNAAAFRKGWEEAYPGSDILQFILKHGGRLALSDDSHGPHAVGLNFDRLVQYLQREGIAVLWFLEYSAELNAAGRPVRAVKMNGNYLEHPFWKNLNIPSSE